MTTESVGGTDAVNDRLLQLLEQVVANQAIQATANLNEEIAQRFAAALQYRDTPAQGGFLSDQRELVLRFRALRSGLGNLARHGAQDTVLLPAPQLLGEVLLFMTKLPPEAETLRLFGITREQTEQNDTRIVQIGQFEHVGEAREVQGIDPGDIVAWLEVDDRHGNPILLGFPQRIEPDDLS
jgi:hypothetical protein